MARNEKPHGGLDSGRETPQETFTFGHFRAWPKISASSQCLKVLSVDTELEVRFSLLLVVDLGTVMGKSWICTEILKKVFDA